ncbi:unnamed protein product [Lepidochelys kempii]
MVDARQNPEVNLQSETGRRRGSGSRRETARRVMEGSRGGEAEILTPGAGAGRNTLQLPQNPEELATPTVYSALRGAAALPSGWSLDSSDPVSVPGSATRLWDPGQVT